MNTIRLLITLIFLFMVNPGFTQDKVWSLVECIDTGWAMNISVQQAALDKINAGSDLELNKAQYHPSFNANFSNGFNWGRSIDITRYQFVNGLVNTNNIGLSGSIVLFDGFVTPTRIKQSRVGIDLAQGQFERQKNFIAISIASAYLQILLAHEKHELIANQLSVTRNLLFVTSNYLDKGLKSEGDVLQVIAQVAQEESDSIQAENTLRLAKLSLMQLMELSYSPDFNVDRFDPENIINLSSIPPIHVLFDSAVLNVPEIINAKLNLEISELELKATKGNYYPTLSVNGGIGTNYSSSAKLLDQVVTTEEKPIGYLATDPSQIVVGDEVNFTTVTSDYPYFSQLDDNFNSSVIIALSIPIYNRKQVKVSEQKADISIAKAQLNLQNEKNLLRKDIETDYLEYVLLSKQLDASKKLLDAYRESYKKLQKQFELQLSNAYELLVEKNKVSAVESEIVQLQYQQLFKHIILRYYLTGTVNLSDQ